MFVKQQELYKTPGAVEESREWPLVYLSSGIPQDGKSLLFDDPNLKNRKALSAFAM